MTIKDDGETIKRKLEEESAATVSVALFGQPGAGKSTLINKLVGEKVAETGVETDKTVSAAAYEAKGLRFVDLPGYGTANFPKETYFDKFDLDSIDLFLCVTSGKLHAADTEFFKKLTSAGKVCIFVVNKRDELWEDDATPEELEERKRLDVSKHVGKDINLLFTSCRSGYGLDALVKEIEGHLSEAKRERWARGAQAYSQEFLDRKKAACEKQVVLAAGVSAANAINPLPGVDVAIDIGVLLKLFADIRNSYGLSDALLASLRTSSIPIVVSLTNTVAGLAAKEGLMLLLKSIAGRETIKTVSKYIPLVGQAIAASIGFGITYAAGRDFLNDCHKLAQEILEHNLRR